MIVADDRVRTIVWVVLYEEYREDVGQVYGVDTVHSTESKAVDRVRRLRDGGAGFYDAVPLEVDGERKEF